MMYRCDECGSTFETPEEWQETRGEFWGVMSYENMAGCPNCYSTCYEEIKGEQNDDG